MNRRRESTVLFWANTVKIFRSLVKEVETKGGLKLFFVDVSVVKERIGLLIKIENFNGSSKFSITAKRQGKEDVERSRRLTWSMEVDSVVIEELEIHNEWKSGATLSGELAEAVKGALENGILFRIP